jgi:uncharacterized protein VirK/YbjX
MYKEILKAARTIYPSNSFNSLKIRLRYCILALLNYSSVQSCIKQIRGLGYAQLFNHEMPILAVIDGPYIHNQWNVKKRLEVILRHYQIIKTMPNVLNQVDQHAKIILYLCGYSEGTFITLDKPRWFVREGEIVLNLFKDELRLMSLAFTFSKLNDELIIYIGALQGAHADDDSLASIRAITKDYEGLRPRDLLLEIVCMIAEKVGVKRILAVSDEHRHHRHKYFGNSCANKLKANYDLIWLENRGELLDNGFYSLPLKKIRRLASEMPNNKRGMYRRRYELLDKIQAEINQVLQ